MGSPGYGSGAGRWIGAKTIKVPLRKDYSHDVEAMIKADPNAGAYYICNPNNPTGTLTPREEIEYALAHKPKGSILLVDEAYIHLSSATSVVDLAGKGEDLIVLRTFSKIYGMAGIRCGLAIGRPDLLAKLQAYFGWNSMCILGSGAAKASLLDSNLVPTRKKLIADTRNQTFDFLRAHNYKFIPSESNCFMIDTGRPGKKIIDAMAAQNVLIGRTWPIWPTYVRVSVGTPTEMARFQTAFHQVMSNPTT
jgi:histidinol-phosphate aminotransferase